MHEAIVDVIQGAAWGALGFVLGLSWRGWGRSAWR